MSEESLAVQKMILDRLAGNAALTALVPAASIFDRPGRPETFPCIVIGESQTIGEDVECGALSEVFSTLHVWSRATGMGEAKRIAGAMRRALRDAGGVFDGYRIDGTQLEDSRFLRDPDGATAHGVVTVVSLVDGGE